MTRGLTWGFVCCNFMSLKRGDMAESVELKSSGYWFESQSWHLCPWARNSVNSSLHPWVNVRSEMIRILPVWGSSWHRMGSRSLMGLRIQYPNFSSSVLTYRIRNTDQLWPALCLYTYGPSIVWIIFNSILPSLKAVDTIGNYSK